MTQNLNRTLTRPLTRLLLKTPMTANQVTLLGLGVGLSAGPLIGQNRYDLNLVGALFFELYYLLDNCDGDIARLKNQQSELGGWLDFTTDAIIHVWLYFWLFLWAKNHYFSLGPLPLVALIGILFSYLIGLWAHYRRFTIAFNPMTWKESKEPLSLYQWLKLNLDNENFALLFLLVVILHLKIPFLCATAIGANFFWISLLIRQRAKFFAY